MQRVLGPGRQISLVQTACFAKRSKIVNRLPRLKPISAVGDNFYASEGSSWSELGASAEVEEALTNQGFARPSRVQVLNIGVWYQSLCMHH